MAENASGSIQVKENVSGSKAWGLILIGLIVVAGVSVALGLGAIATWIVVALLFIVGVVAAWNPDMVLAMRRRPNVYDFAAKSDPASATTFARIMTRITGIFFVIVSVVYLLLSLAS